MPAVVTTKNPVRLARSAALLAGSESRATPSPDRAGEGPSTDGSADPSRVGNFAAFGPTQGGVYRRYFARFHPPRLDSSPRFHLFWCALPGLCPSET